MQIVTTQLVDIKKLKPHEEINEKYLKVLLQDVLKDQAIYKPILVDKISKVILDGHHRFSVAKKLNLATIPALLVDYFDDSIISVYSRRKELPVTKTKILKAGLHGSLFPHKSTRHVLHIPYSVVPHSLSTLKQNVIEYVYIKHVGKKGKGVFARQDLKKGQVVVVGKPTAILPQRTVHSFQIDWNTHAELEEPAGMINHSCSPNTGIQNNEFGGYNFISLKDIQKDQEITWNYGTTEYDSLIWQSQCICGAKECKGRIRGFRYLSENFKKNYGKFIANYLKFDK